MQKEFFVILDYFLPFDPPINLKNQNFEKIRKTTGNIITLHLCTINDDHDVWFLRYKARQTECFVILVYFLPLYPLTTQKIKILKKWKKLLEISWFYISASRIMIICHTVPEIWRVTDVIFIFHFGLFFAFLSSFYTSVP